MAIGDVIPEIVHGGLLRYLAQRNMWAGLTNRMFEADLANFGDSVTIAPVDASVVTVANYVPGTTVVGYPAATAGAKVTLDLNKTKFWSFQLDDVHRQEARPDILGGTLRVAADKMGTVMRDDVRASFVAGIAAPHKYAMVADIDYSSNLGLAAGTESAISKTFAKVGLMMDGLKVPSEGRWAVMGPLVSSHLVRESAAFSMTPEGLVVAARRSGQPEPTLMGFRIVSDPHHSPALAGGKYTDQVVFGTNYSCGLVVALSKVERLRLEGSFATAVRGLMHYGAKVIEPKSLFLATAEYKSVTLLAA